ncbi:MAG: exodeoxyribonuclease small subunit [Rickettsiales bacterium]|jgi:exodeoxyribonuclease VII small subunit|nr:exodeoxyribonuclease small subunit [Rickettsiales bacterium]
MAQISKSAIGKLSFEEALVKLEEVVGRLEGGKENLESALEYYTAGTLLKAHCEKKLAEAKLTVERIAAGNTTSKGADEDE